MAAAPPKWPCGPKWGWQPVPLTGVAREAASRFPEADSQLKLHDSRIRHTLLFADFILYFSRTLYFTFRGLIEERDEMIIYDRWMESNLQEALQTWRVVSIAGARQCGKTTLAKRLPTKTILPRSLDSETFLQAASEDPQSFVQHPVGTTLFIDEIQKEPRLLPAIKSAVDTSNRPGQFLLTGSSHLKAIPGVTESLAGRLHTIRLHTLTEGEFRGGKPDFPARAFSGEFPSRLTGGTKREIVESAFRGGYPEPARIREIYRPVWHRDYLEQLLTHDIADVAQIRKVGKLRDLFLFLAARSSKLWNTSEIATLLEISKVSVENYIAALEAMYLFDRVPSWTGGDYDRVVKRPKWFIGDTGTMCAVLKWKQAEVMLDGDRSGKLIESWVYHELSAAVGANAGYEIFHYRDREQREVDFLLENNAGELVGIEVKAGSVVRKDDFKSLLWFQRTLGGTRYRRSSVLYSGADTLSFGDGLLAVPLASLFC